MNRVVKQVRSDALRAAEINVTRLAAHAGIAITALFDAANAASFLHLPKFVTLAVPSCWHTSDRTFAAGLGARQGTYTNISLGHGG